MLSPLEKFQSLLRELFQFEQADLDFGVYRIMNLRRERMEKWLNEELPARARAILKQGGNTADDDLGGRLEVLKAALLELEPGGVDEDGNITKDFLKESTKGKEYLKLKAQADRAPARTAAGMEPLVYNHLYDFFSRYYETGDFVPKRRRSFAPDGRDTYAIPWDGEEVVLHWANKDQYYIKTGERFTHYRWQSEMAGRTFTVEFRLTDADLPANNTKDAKKKFNLLVADKVEWQEDKATLILPFHYRGLMPEEEGQLIGTQEAKLRESIIRRTVDALRELPAIVGVPQLATALMAPKRDAAGQEKRDKDGNAVPLLPHHLNRWAVKNESDFFIHKDLRRFLSGELDYFLKSVVLNLDNLLAAGEQRAEPNFRLLDAVKRLGTEIVDFVSQLEDFQKALFEKKKFVLETSWCLTLDRIPVSVKEEVYTAILANDRQWGEWETLYKISQWPAGLATVAPRTREFLDAYPFLILDSRFLTVDLATTLLASIEDLDANCDGVCIHGDNTDALRTIRERYNEGVGIVNIDPPYNTGSDGFCYKDGYKSSSWLAQQKQTLPLAQAVLEDKGSLFAFTDENEIRHFAPLIEDAFGTTNFVETIIWNKRIPKNDKGIGNIHDFVLLVAKDLAHRRSIELEYKMRKDELDDIYELVRKCKTAAMPLEQTQIELKKFYRKQGYDRGLTLYCELDQNYEVWGKINMSWPNAKTEGPRYEVINPVTGVACPIPDNGWRWKEETFRKAERDGPRFTLPDGSMMVGRIWYSTKTTIQPSSITYLREVESFLLRSIMSVKSDGSVTLDNLGLGGLFDYPKSVLLIERLLFSADGNESVILDYFGGSGTTGHAVVNLNREDEGKRKYLLVEMGAYFDTVLLPRLKKVVFSSVWQGAVPVCQSGPAAGTNPYNGISHCIKILRLESYEDALDNIEFNSGADPGAELGLDFSRDYELRYALDWESKDCPTRLAVAQLDTPFDYTLTLRRESGTVDVKPDLPETFAYLIGLHTRRRFRTERDDVSYLIYTGTLHSDGTEVAVLWRTCKDWTEANLKEEMSWWRAQRETLAPGATRVYVNGASAIEGHHSLDAEFKMRMHGGTV